MNAAETIQAAIEKLGSHPDEEWSLSDVESHGIAAGPADLIVTLHRTIDAQLAILREAAASGITEMVVTNPEQFKGVGAALYRTAVDLARAILGEVA